MKNQRFIAVFLACQAFTLLTTFGSNAAAQTRVAIVDIGAVFKSHAEFTQRLDALRAEAEQFKSASQSQQQQLMQKAEVLKQYSPGSLEFKQAESSLAQESAALEVEQRDAMRKLMQTEAKLHFDTYAQVNQLIADYCDQQGIQLVLRFNGDPMDPKNINTIMQRVNGSIVFYEPDRNITTQIIGTLPQSTRSADLGAGATQR